MPPSELTTHGLPLGPTDTATAPPSTLSQSLPFQRKMPKPPGTSFAPMTQIEPSAPTPMSLALPAMFSHSSARRFAGTGELSIASAQAVARTAAFMKALHEKGRAD